MKFIGKIKQLENGCKTSVIYFCGFKIWYKEKNPVRRFIKILGIPVFSKKNTMDFPPQVKLFDSVPSFFRYVQDKNADKSSKKLLWLNHSLGGGTETYTSNQFLKLKDTHTVFYLKYFPVMDYFSLYVLDTACCYVRDINELKEVLSCFAFSEICVNSLVGWKDIQEMLTVIQKYKAMNKEVKLSFRVHDFHSVCPSVQLMNCHNEFCNLLYKDGCENCIKNIQSAKSEYSCKHYFLGFNTIFEWRKMWGEFFHIVDEVIAFSNSSREILLQEYPVLDEKIKIIPHQVNALAKVSIQKHTGINIAVLGHVYSIGKGRLVIEEMCKNMAALDVQLYVIGTYSNPPQNLIVTGKYSPEDLPCLMEKYQIDIIFIPSVWPETFSYTTSEAMSMGMPVACYNLGAPAERLKNYAKGLVLKNIAPDVNLKEIKNFVENL